MVVAEKRQTIILTPGDSEVEVLQGEDVIRINLSELHWQIQLSPDAARRLAREIALTLGRLEQRRKDAEEAGQQAEEPHQ